jgi:hypothetical protein
VFLVKVVKTELKNELCVFWFDIFPCNSLSQLEGTSEPHIACYSTTLSLQRNTHELINQLPQPIDEES